MSQDLLAFAVAAVVFVSGMAGLAYRAWYPGNEEEVAETRDLINRLTGLVATLSALVLGLLIASANNFYNTQKGGLETISARVLELDGVLRRYGPDAQPARTMLKDLITGSYERVWRGNNHGATTMPSVEGADEQQMNGLFLTLNALREAAPAERKYLMAKAGDLAESINNQYLQISLQLSNSLSWPFMTILVAWASLLFFGFGMLGRVNRASVVGLAVGAISVAAAIFLIVELSTPYSGLLRLSPTPVLQTIEALGK
ncbi:MAG TPA: hypothetical protein VKI44_43165 [Acetobacteraceae bacterium]|nr:hypothetical protein [Acetobacteraceae bacterium]